MVVNHNMKKNNESCSPDGFNNEQMEQNEDNGYAAQHDSVNSQHIENILAATANSFYKPVTDRQIVHFCQFLVPLGLECAIHGDDI